MIDRGERESAVRRETGVPARLVRSLATGSGPSPAQPDRATARELAVLHYMRDYASNDIPPQAEHVAAIMEIDLEEADRTFQSLARKGLIYHDPDPYYVETPVDDRIPNEPRMARALIRQATRGGYYEGRNEQDDIDVILAQAMIDAGTKRIRIEAADAARLIDRSSQTELNSPARWPAPDPMYIEFSDLVPAGPTLDSHVETGFEGVVIAKQQGQTQKRAVTFINSHYGYVTKYMFPFDPSTGQIDSTGLIDPLAEPVPPQAATTVANILLGLLHHIGPAGLFLTPAPETPEETARRQRGEPVMEWLVVQGTK